MNVKERVLRFQLDVTPCGPLSFDELVHRVQTTASSSSSSASFGSERNAAR
jgi:hypothetical protein